MNNTFSIPYESLRALYLADLGQPDPSHSREQKVRRLGPWQKIIPYSRTGIFLNISEAWEAGRNIYTFSDIHFGHKNIMKYSGRPYPTADLMNECIIGNYINTVHSDDIVIWCGDIGFMAESRINDILNRLPGYKIQIVGNHDIHRDGKLYELDFDERHLCLGTCIDNTDFIFTHYPLTNIPNCMYNIHGHIHQHLTPNERNINVCVEHTNYTPMNMSTILNKIFGPND